MSSPEASARRNMDSTRSIILADVADAQGNVDAYMARYSAEHLAYGTIAPDVARRLLDAGRVQETFDIIARCEWLAIGHTNFGPRHRRLSETHPQPGRERPLFPAGVPEPVSLQTAHSRHSRCRDAARSHFQKRSFETIAAFLRTEHLQTQTRLCLAVH